MSKLLSDEEVFRRVRAKPEVQKALAETLEAVKKGSTGPGISAEELPAFLREQEEAEPAKEERPVR